MNATHLAAAKLRKRRSIGVSVGVHIALIVLGLMPLMTQVEFPVQYDEMVEIEILFADASESGGSAPAEAAVPVEEIVTPPEEVVVEEVEIEETMINEVEEEVIPVVEEITEEVVEEIVEEEPIVEEMTTEDASTTEIDSEGGDGVYGESDNSGYGNGPEADGVITRRVIHRADIAEAADYTGTIVIDICIDRSGKILTARNNPDATTVDDMDMVRKALEIATLYRFERDFGAARRECGSLTFIFDVENETNSVHLIADAGME